MSRDHEKTSKFLSYVLRHKPDAIGLALDSNGWASVQELIEKANATGENLSEPLIHDIVRTNEKKRFALSEDGSKIRASQGHSIHIELGLEPKQPPELLYHGTASRFLDVIRSEGLKSMDRQHVHLSIDEITATKVGQRHGKPVILVVNAGDMWRAGQQFFLSENGVWLTDKVDVRYLTFPR
jgi:putative RNA 2'-phosphotransferase